MVYSLLAVPPLIVRIRIGPPWVKIVTLRQSLLIIRDRSHSPPAQGKELGTRHPAFTHSGRASGGVSYQG
jgi:hypothetical protein